jgi:hypothetical protein
MSYSAVGLAGEVCEGAGGSCELVVEPYADGEREEFGRDPGAESAQGAGVVAFESELVSEGPEDRPDALADRRKMRATAGFVSGSGGEQPCGGRVRPLFDHAQASGGGSRLCDAGSRISQEESASLRLASIMR